MRIVIPGRPPSKGTHKRVAVSKDGRPFPYSTKRAKDFYKAVDDEVKRKGLMKIESGKWKLWVHWCHDQRSMVDEFDDNPKMDIDAPVSLILDALQRADALDDDARVTQLHVCKFWDKENPRVEIEMWEVYS